MSPVLEPGRLSPASTVVLCRRYQRRVVDLSLGAAEWTFEAQDHAARRLRPRTVTELARLQIATARLTANVSAAAGRRLTR
jgi:hypothetical protein